MNFSPVSYRGRFAPTPSGPLHLGSLMTALAGFLEARKAGGKWLLRIDDLDAPRCRPEHVDTILRQLDAHGLHWDEPPRHQSAHVDEYQAAFTQLLVEDRLYRCQCTRAELAASSTAGPDGAVYGGTCRNRSIGDAAPSAWRIALTAGTPLQLADLWRGSLVRDQALDIGDFVVKRSDGQIGYQLACVVDDLAMQISHVVRGADLIGSSLRQMALFQQLSKTPPRYGHLQVLAGPDGRKLSKQNHAQPVDLQHAADNLQHCLHLLGQNSPECSSISELLLTAIDEWNPCRLPKVDAVLPLLSS